MQHIQLEYICYCVTEFTFHAVLSTTNTLIVPVKWRNNMPEATINGFNMYYETAGTGFPLVFVHGGFGGLGTGMGAEIPAWRERFAQHFEVITYDRRASGRSGFPTDGFTMENFSRDI